MAKAIKKFISKANQIKFSLSINSDYDKIITNKKIGAINKHSLKDIMLKPFAPTFCFLLAEKQQIVIRL